jgi:hypothetical protein
VWPTSVQQNHVVGHGVSCVVRRYEIPQESGIETNGLREMKNQNTAVDQVRVHTSCIVFQPFMVTPIEPVYVLG